MAITRAHEHLGDTAEANRLIVFRFPMWDLACIGIALKSTQGGKQ